METGCRIEKAFPSNEVWVVGYANGYFDYLIGETVEQRATNTGDYEGGVAPRLIGYLVKSSDTARFESAAIGALRKVL